MNEDEKKEAIEAYVAGESAVTIGKRYNVKPFIIRGIVKRSGVPMRTRASNNAKKWANVDVPSLLEDYKSGILMSQLKSKYGISHADVLNLLEDNGVERRTQKETCNLPSWKEAKPVHVVLRTPGMKEEVLRLYNEELWTLEEIGKKYKVTGATVRYWIATVLEAPIRHAGLARPEKYNK